MTIRIPRFLVPFAPKRVAHYFTDILVIGAGLAGMRAASAVDKEVEVLIVTKNTPRESNSNYAQGGIAGVMSDDDSYQQHILDTLTAGGSLCNREIVEMVIRAAPTRIAELIDWGTQFDRDEAGQLLLGREGGHERHRILHALGDATGREIMRAMIEHVRRLPNVQMWPNTFTLDLLEHEGRCRGTVQNANEEKILIWAKQTILCTGGSGQIYRESTNPAVATGDGHAMAYRAGAELQDMEFIQFHPTVLYIAGSSRSLITEAMRGEGAHLVDSDGRRFMPDYDQRAELAPRDVVAQAIVDQMEKTRRPNVFLDLSHLDPDYVRSRFPGIAHVCTEFGIDIATDRIPVRPGAHYMIGGVAVDDRGSTSLPGLWAAGEVTSSGLHGANRLASNSLLEGLVYGERAGVAAAKVAASVDDQLQAIPLTNTSDGVPSGEALDLSDIRNSLKSLMWRAGGVRRERHSLHEALASINHWCQYVLPCQFDLPVGWELQNMLAVARLIIQAAISREESRGVHFRQDFPETDDTNWRRHLAFRYDIERTNS